ncbi:MAG: DUF2802 domain-containing protein [Natronospirillum sp.]|uniref:DUF2802 domain-containing protein n=1 Tax=Natronospirillum sp. TaxID=2812955 RepID=UPI0025E44221|nr:DUF2802 domain-containing protein [Natronospirillum sp.]MCH8551299.1 DUF2802 domain-containing protein [Natronospirillum sp.]
MPLIQESTGLLLAFVGSALLSLILLLAWLSASSRARAQALETQRMRRELGMIQAGNIGLGKKLLSLQREVIRMRQDTGTGTQVVSARAKAANDQHWQAEEALREFDQAQNLLAQGSDLDQVIRQTGLTRSEAELIQLLYQPQSA